MIEPDFSFPWTTPLLNRLRRHFEAEGRDGAHDFSHALRVAKNACALAEEAHADIECCLAASLLHDLVSLPKNHPDSSRTGFLSSELALLWCAETPGLEDKAKAIASAIATHSFSSGAVPTSLEGAVVQDADRLEAIGAIGLARCFATGGAMGAALWHAQDPWAVHRPLNDKQFSLDHFELKLLNLAHAMNTEAGRRRAESRHLVLTQFLEALKQEI